MKLKTLLLVLAILCVSLFVVACGDEDTTTTDLHSLYLAARNCAGVRLVTTKNIAIKLNSTANAITNRVKLVAFIISFAFFMCPIIIVL